MKAVDRGPQRRSKPDIFLSHSSKDRQLALKLATDLNFCGIDVWLDEWEIQIGQSLVDALGNAMEQARFVGILISENYNKSVWTKREYRQALSREVRENRIIMLPLILGAVDIPEFLEDKKYLDLREQYYSGLVQIAGIVHGLSDFRTSCALRKRPPQNIKDIWELLGSLGFEPFVVLGRDDFEEILMAGGTRVREDYAYFYPDSVHNDLTVSEHVKSLLSEVFPPNKITGANAGGRAQSPIRTREAARVAQF